MKNFTRQNPLLSILLCLGIMALIMQALWPIQKPFPVAPAPAGRAALPRRPEITPPPAAVQTAGEYDGKIVIVVDPGRRTVTGQNDSTFRIFDCQFTNEFVFPRDTVYYAVVFRAVPTPQTPPAIYTNLDNELMKGGNF